ncbi:heavy metal translocating P-type ATPase metal-binding domain-containing protein [Mucilaginibacter sp.]
MMQTASIEKTACYHCGDDCLTPACYIEEKQFCCLGCKSVFEVLSESKLCNYYSYNDHPGVNRLHIDKRFDYLNEPDIVNELIDYKDDNITIVTFYIPQIHCSSCLWLLEQLNKMNPAIHYGRVDFLKKQLNVRYNHHQLNLQHLVELLYNIGYEPVISLQDIIKKQNSPTKDNLVQKIAVAGFCFGNVMLLSFPEYFGISVYEQAFKHFFGWVNILFALPVVFYSGRGYFISAWQNLQIKVLNIDFPLALGIGVLFLRSIVDVAINNKDKNEFGLF